MKKIILPIMLVIMILPLCVVKADKVDKVIYQTSFETEEERNFWDLTGDLDGDGNTWGYKSAEQSIVYNAYDGIYSLYSCSRTEEEEPLTPDNLAISDPITIDNYNIDQDVRINWYVASQSILKVAEQYSVYIFKGDETTEDIKTALKNNTAEALYNETLNETVKSYHYRTMDINEKLNEWYGNTNEEKTIRIVFRHHNSTNQFALKIDSVSIEKYHKNFAYFSFEEGLEGWTPIDYDGDGHNWEHKTGADYGLDGYNSEGTMASASYDEASNAPNDGVLTPENYIVSPKIKIDSKYDEVKLEWYVGAYDEDYFQEQYSVYVYSGTEELTKDNIKTKLSDESLSQKLHSETLSTHEFSLKTVKIDEKFIGKEVQIIFVHHDCTGIYWLKVDDVTLYGYITEESNSGGTTPPIEEEVILGDWNSDGEFNLVDLIAYRIYLIGGDMSKYYTGEITEELKTKIDLNADKEINLLDLISARKLLVGLPIN